MIKKLNSKRKWLKQCLGVRQNIFDIPKTFRYFICKSEPQFDSNPTKNFAYSQHKNEDHSKIQQFQYHVIAAVGQLLQSIYNTMSLHLFCKFHMLLFSNRYWPLPSEKSPPETCSNLTKMLRLMNCCGSLSGRENFWSAFLYNQKIKTICSKT